MMNDFLNYELLPAFYPSEFVDFFQSKDDPLAFFFDEWKKKLLKFIKSKGPRSPEESLFRDIRHAELVYIDPSATVESFVSITGPCYIGPHALIRQGAYIRSNTFIGPHVLVGHASEIKGSVLLEGAKASHFAYVGDSVLGEHVNLGAGVKCANLRLDRNEIHVQYPEGQKPSTLNKLGAFVGHHSQIGCNAVLNPGSYLKPHSSVAPLQSY
jgi:NDP-sugar pyrophosphorylase family protein